MPHIRMKSDRTNPTRKAGSVYVVPSDTTEGWDLVREGHAEWVYVPEDKAADLLHAEPKNADPATKRAATTAAKAAIPALPATGK